jgi:hypothetical protein
MNIIIKVKKGILFISFFICNVSIFVRVVMLVVIFY